MTKQEAIIELRLRQNCTIGGIKKEEWNALEMAIEALSEPSKVDFRTDKSANIGTEVNDLISRSDALMELNGACSNWQDDAKVAEIIHALPSADTVPIEQYRELQHCYVMLAATFAEYLQKEKTK